MSILQDKLKKLNPKYVTMATFILPVALLALFLYFIYIPSQKTLSDLEAEILKNESQIAQSQVMERRLGELKAANRKLQEELKAATEILPTSEEEARLPDMITEMAKSSGVAVKSVTPGKKTPAPNGYYFQTPIAVEASGNYHRIGKLMENIDKITRLVTVSEIGMASAKLEGKEMNIPVKFTVLAFTSGGGK